MADLISHTEPCHDLGIVSKVTMSWDPVSDVKVGNIAFPSILKPEDLSREAEIIDAPLVLQKEFGLTDAKSRYPVIGTFGLMTCVCVAIHSPSTLEAAVVHMDHKTELGQLRKIIGLLKGAEAVNASVIGGPYADRSIISSVVKELLSVDGAKIRSVDAFHLGLPEAVCIDARNGEILPNKMPCNPLDGLEFEQRSAELANLGRSALRQGFDLRKG